ETPLDARRAILLPVGVPVRETPAGDDAMEVVSVVRRRAIGQVGGSRDDQRRDLGLLLDGPAASRSAGLVVVGAASVRRSAGGRTCAAARCAACAARAARGVRFAGRVVGTGG